MDRNTQRSLAGIFALLVGLPTQSGGASLPRPRRGNKYMLGTAARFVFAPFRRKPAAPPNHLAKVTREHAARRLHLVPQKKDGNRLGKRRRLRLAGYVEHAHEAITFTSSGPVTTTWPVN